MKAIKILLKIIGICLLIALTLWLISYGIGFRIYLRETSNIPKLATLEQQQVYVANKEKEIFKDINVYKLIFAGGGWRYKAVLKLNQKIFEYFPQEANDNVNALFQLADCYTWLGGKNYSYKAISLYQKSIDVFNKKYLDEKALPGTNPELFEMRKYDFLMTRYTQIAKIYLSMKEYDKVINEYQKIINDYSEKVKDFKLFDKYLIIGKAYENIGQVYLRCYKNYDKAIEQFQKVQELFPDSLVISRNKTYIGDCYLAMGNDVKAREVYQSVINDFKHYKGNGKADIASAQERLKKIKTWKKILTKNDVILY